MTTPERRSRKFARALGWLAAGSRSAYSNIQLSAQIEQEVSPFDARSLSRISHIAAAQSAESSRSHSTASSTTIKSP